jgi:hypothetical protein
MEFRRYAIVTTDDVRAALERVAAATKATTPSNVIPLAR